MNQTRMYVRVPWVQYSLIPWKPLHFADSWVRYGNAGFDTEEVSLTTSPAPEVSVSLQIVCLLSQHCCLVGGVLSGS